MFLQDTLKKLKSKTPGQEAGVYDSIMEKVREGQYISKEEILKFCKVFQDELVLDNLSRGQLVAICKFMGVPHYGTDSLMKFLLSRRMQSLKNEDKVTFIQRFHQPHFFPKPRKSWPKEFPT